MWKKILILSGCLILIGGVWFAGFETVYAHIMAFFTNILLGLSGSESAVSVEHQNGAPAFEALVTINGQKATISRRIFDTLYPTIMVLSWVLFVIIINGWKNGLKAIKWTLLPFFSLQIVFLLLFTNYMASVANYMYYILQDSFYVIALAAIIIESIRRDVFASGGRGQ